MDITPNEDWSKEKKIDLRNRILASARSEEYRLKKRKRRRRYIGAAAAVIPLFMVLGYFFIPSNQEPSIEQFVNGVPNNKTQETDKVTVILGKGNRIVLEEDESEVKYSPTGSNVTMGNRKSIEQQVVDNNQPTYNTVIVPFGKRSFIKLSDGTKVWINSGSKLVFPVAFSKTTRVVHLEGEAIFDVSHDKKRPFRVQSSTQSIEVLGTIFNVSHYSEDQVMNTVLKSGSIKITYLNQEDESFVMEPGTMSSFNQSKNQITIKKVDPNGYFSWKDGFMSLDNSSLENIVQRISRYYNVPIEIQGSDLGNLTFSGRLDLSEKVDKVLNTILESANIAVIRKEETIIITHKN